jgi:hypothetical protein
MRGDTLQTALSVSPEPEGRLLFVHAEAPAENERSPAVGHRNVSSSIRSRYVGGGSVVYRKQLNEAYGCPSCANGAGPGG